MKSRILGLLLGLFALLPLWGGDVASFQNLGFSPDGRYFSFGQYGIDSQTKNPYAEIYTVDVRGNSFVSGGVWKKVYPVGTTIGDTGQKALFALMEETRSLRNRLNLDYLQLGRPVYFRVIGEATPERANAISVLDYATGRTYDALINENITGSGANASSSFSIGLEVSSATGAVLGNYTVGNPAFRRSGVLDYTIVQMILSPGGHSAIFVVEREEDDGNGGVNIRYMVETLRL